MPRRALGEMEARAGTRARVVAEASTAAQREAGAAGRAAAGECAATREPREPVAVPARGGAVPRAGRHRPRARAGRWQAGATVDEAAVRRREAAQYLWEAAELLREAADPEVGQAARAGRTAARAEGRPRKVARRARMAAAVDAPVFWPATVAQGIRTSCAQRLFSDFTRSHEGEAGEGAGRNRIKPKPEVTREIHNPTTNELSSALGGRNGVLGRLQPIKHGDAPKRRDDGRRWCRWDCRSWWICHLGGGRIRWHAGRPRRRWNFIFGWEFEGGERGWWHAGRPRRRWNFIFGWEFGGGERGWWHAGRPRRRWNFIFGWEFEGGERGWWHGCLGWSRWKWWFR